VNRSSSPAQATLTLLDGNGSTVAQTTISVPASNFQQASLATYFPAITYGSYDILSMRVSSTVSSAISAYASVIDNRSQDPIYMQGARAAGGSSLMLAAVGRVPGANGTFWRSDVTFFNPAPYSVSLNLRYLPTNTDNRGATTTSIPVGAGQTVVLRDLVSRFGVTSGQGALEVSWSGSAGPVVTSRTYTTDAAGGSYGQAVDPISTWSRDLYVTGIRSDSSFRANLGFVNSGDQPLSVTVSLIAPSGQTFATGYVSVPARSQVQGGTSSLFPGIGADNLGNFTMKVHTDGGATLSAYASMIDNASGDPVYLAGR
jgi:hypothetical protein